MKLGEILQKATSTSNLCAQCATFKAYLIIICQKKIALLTFVVVKNAFVVLYSPRKDAGMKQDRQVRQSVFVPVTNSLCKKK